MHWKTDYLIRLLLKRYLPRPLRSRLRLQFELIRHGGASPRVAEAPGAACVLVLAPHMDDEVIGCGGTLTLSVKKGSKVSVVYLTDGSKGYDVEKYVREAENDRRQREIRLADRRKVEALKAGMILGLEAPIFLDLPDRGLEVEPRSVERLADILHCAEPQVIFVPFLGDPHPDHWMTNCLFVEAAARADLKRSVQCWGYEVWSPLLSNTVVDITDVIKHKKDAMKTFSSQNSNVDYPRVALGLNTYRSLLARHGQGFAEAFYVAELDLYKGIYEAVRIGRAK